MLLTVFKEDIFYLRTKSEVKGFLTLNHYYRVTIFIINIQEDFLFFLKEKLWKDIF